MTASQGLTGCVGYEQVGHSQNRGAAFHDDATAGPAGGVQQEPVVG